MKEEITIKDKNVKVKRCRAWELDFLRGAAILLVIFDHSMLTFWGFRSDWLQTDVSWLANLGDYAKAYWVSDTRLFWRPLFVFVFFFVSGLCTSFSRNNFKRGLKLVAVAVFVSVATYILEHYIFMESGFFIMFGVLHCMAVIILFYAVLSFLSNLITKNNRYVLAVICLVLGTIAIILNIKYNLTLAEVTVGPRHYIETEHQWLGLFIYVESWWSADYFPLLPFLGHFLLGAGISVFLYPNKKSLVPKLDGKWHTPITFVGKYSLLIYIMIQVIATGVAYLLTYIGTGSFIV